MRKKQGKEDKYLSSPFKSYKLTNTSKFLNTPPIWRIEQNSLSIPKSKGIDPRSFHFLSTKYHDHETPVNSYRRKKTQSKLGILLIEAKNRAIHHEFSRYYLNYRNKLAVYKKMTSYKIWPIQDLAFIDFDRLCGKMMNSDECGALKKGKIMFNNSGDWDKTDLSSCSSLEDIRSQMSLFSPSISEFKYKKKNRLKGRNFDNFPFFEYTDHKVSSEKEDTLIKCSYLTPLWSMAPRIFAIEVSRKGRRKYIVCHLGRFMDHYWRRLDSESGRHYYELIREGVPCRLYFGEFIYLIENLYIFEW